MERLTTDIFECKIKVDRLPNAAGFDVRGSRVYGNIEKRINHHSKFLNKSLPFYCFSITQSNIMYSDVNCHDKLFEMPLQILRTNHCQ